MGEAAPHLRDRIVELRRVPARDLLANPRNFRRHPPAQRAALDAVLEKIGMAGALLARDTPGGLELIDGHLRTDSRPDAEALAAVCAQHPVPVGLTKLIGPHPERAVQRLPEKLRLRMQSTRKGYVFRP